MIEENTKIYSNEDYLVYKMVTGGRWKENCYLVRFVKYDQVILIDPGDDPHIICSKINSMGSKLTHIFLTHGHHDHVGAAAYISDHYGINCTLHSQDKRIIMHAPMYAIRFAGKNIRIPNLITFCEEDVFMIGDISIEVIHTPGHTPGSACIRIESCLFTGDTLLYKAIGRSDLPNSNGKELKTSINKLLERTKKDLIILPGHGRSWSVNEAKTWWKEVIDVPPQLNTFDIAD
ncbi:glyoxylase-like metal-dependent hydrolase (beta-lactamase superfamily II) [Anaerosolibacter carboniphilus]|uniref:Glyoxylase-like metal-dependent hydrolase (Beta-lactamase superfamily II) n=1 Tax=Anaerosolibacter carboniphilus TaxID=1417629 RepID=A0A841KS78_9FIRM|nr:MBL fold metallo-hydrolase [Anaerosolibacter carboniphilus]MBB6216426.1 glyoxylase-like metal-dependent hydrolase (beta-lactamase superfamily II) [Anaerosolibacter carboniphilus]